MAQKPQDSAKGTDNNPEKERALSAALAQIERQFGKGSMMRLGDRTVGDTFGVYGFIGLRCGSGHWRIAAGSSGRDLWARVLR